MHYREVPWGLQPHAPSLQPSVSQVLLALSGALIGVAIPDAHTTKRDLERLSKARLPGKGLGEDSEGYVMLHQLVAAMKLQRAYRRRSALKHGANKPGDKPKRNRRGSRGSKERLRRGSFSLGLVVPGEAGRWRRCSANPTPTPTPAPTPAPTPTPAPAPTPLLGPK